MSRQPAKYANRKGKPVSRRGESFSADVPVGGYYSVKLRKDGPPVALFIWYGFPREPGTLAAADRAPRWQALLNGTELVPIERFWPDCATRRIEKAEYQRLRALNQTLEPESAFYDGRRPINRLKVPLPF